MQYLVTVLGIDDDHDDVISMSQEFDKDKEIEYQFTSSYDEFFHMFNKDVWVVIIDYLLKGTDGQQVLDRVIQINPDCHPILISGVITPEMEVRLGLSGAKDCIEKRKGWEFRLAAAVKRHIELVQPKIAKRERDQKLSNEIKNGLSKIRNA